MDDLQEPALSGVSPESVEALRRQVARLDDSISFRGPLHALARLEQQLTELPSRLQYLNSRGVTYELAVGEAVGHLTQRLRAAAASARALAEQERHQLLSRVAELGERVEALPRPLSAGEHGGDAEAVPSVASAAESLQARVAHAERDIDETFRAVDAEVEEILHKVAHLESVADELKGARWTPAVGELVRDAVRAAYHQKPGRIVNGLLFLTTQRLLFERREEVLRGILFLRRPRQLSEVVWEIAPGQITEVAFDPERGELRVSSDARPTAVFELRASPGSLPGVLLRSTRAHGS